MTKKQKAAFRRLTMKIIQIISKIYKYFHKYFDYKTVDAK